MSPNTKTAEAFLLQHLWLQVDEFKAFSVTVSLWKDLNTNSTANDILSFKTMNQVFKLWWFTIHITKCLCYCYNNYDDISRYF